jgi:hypothetical protein
MTNYIVTGQSTVSSLFDRTRSATLISEAELAAGTLRFGVEDRVCISSESSLDLVMSRLDDDATKAAVAVMKNKLRFREAARSLVPEFFFHSATLDELDAVRLPEGLPCVLKPLKGFFARGIRFVDASTDLAALRDGLRAELAASERDFSEHVITTQEFLIEQRLFGEEYAADFYFDDRGQPVILNIMHHPHHSDFSYMHALYHTSCEIFERLHAPLMALLRQLNAILGIRNFPVHAEFIEHEGRLIPVEFNPLRFGGFGLADLTWFALGINPWDAYFAGASVDALAILQSSGTREHYGWVMAYNGKDVDPHTRVPNHDRMRRELGTILHYERVDHRRQPVSALAYVRDDLAHLQRILNYDFNRYWD